MNVPVGNDTQLTPAGQSSATPGLPRTSGKAITSLVCGLFFFLFPLALAAVVFGHISISEIQKSAGRIAGRGMAVAGLVLGYLGLSIIPVLIIAAIAIPNLLRARIAANEESAAASVHILNTAEIAYATQHPDLGFSCNLNDLNLDGRLAAGVKNGYIFQLQNCAPRESSGPNVSFQLLAVPQRRNTTGARVFCSDESMVVRYSARWPPENCLLFGNPLR